jgi:hypothetical protein
MTRRSGLAVGAFLAWTIFVWGVVRVRNILGDDELSSSDRVVPLLLSASLWVPALVLGVVLVVALVRRRPLPSAARIGVAALGVWTVLIWLVRAYDIALVGEDGQSHEVPFIVVHLVLAVVSVGLAVLAARSLREVPDRRAPQPVGG